jgi:hypothetical protein
VLQIKFKFVDNFFVPVRHGAERRQTLREIGIGPALAIKDSGPIAQSFFGGGSYRKFKIMSGVWHSSPLMGYCGFVKAFYLARSGEPQEVGGLGVSDHLKT